MTRRTLFVPGIPAPQGSKKYVGNGVMVESSKKLSAWRKHVVKVCRQADLDPLPAVPLTMTLSFVMPRLKAHFGTGRNAETLKANAPTWHTSYPDGSKIQRAIEDALVTSGLIPDDRYIAHWVGSKTYGPEPGVLVCLDVIEGAR